MESPRNAPLRHLRILEPELRKALPCPFKTEAAPAVEDPSVKRLSDLGCIGWLSGEIIFGIMRFGLGLLDSGTPRLLIRIIRLYVDRYFHHPAIFARPNVPQQVFYVNLLNNPLGFKLINLITSPYGFYPCPEHTKARAEVLARSHQIPANRVPLGLTYAHTLVVYSGCLRTVDLGARPP